MRKKNKTYEEQDRTASRRALIAEAVGMAIIIGFAVVVASIICAAIQEAK